MDRVLGLILVVVCLLHMPILDAFGTDTTEEEKPAIIKRTDLPAWKLIRAWENDDGTEDWSWGDRLTLDDSDEGESNGDSDETE